MMDSKAITETILEAVRQEISTFIETENSITSSVEYEKKVIEICRNIGKELIKNARGKVPKSRNLKKKF